MSEPEDKVHCRIYKSTRRAEMYLYLKQEENFDDVPGTLLGRLGRLEFVMDLELHPQRKLARVEAADVIKSLQERGWFLQLPPVRNARGDRGGG